MVYIHIHTRTPTQHLPNTYPHLHIPIHTPMHTHIHIHACIRAQLKTLLNVCFSLLGTTNKMDYYNKSTTNQNSYIFSTNNNEILWKLAGYPFVREN